METSKKTVGKPRNRAGFRQKEELLRSIEYTGGEGQEKLRGKRPVHPELRSMLKDGVTRNQKPWGGGV